MNLCEILFNLFEILVRTALMAKSDDTIDITREDKAIGMGVVEAVVDLILNKHLCKSK